MDLYQVDANKSCFEFKLCDNVWKIMKVFIQDVVVEISIKKKTHLLSWHNRDRKTQNNSKNR